MLLVAVLGAAAGPPLAGARPARLAVAFPSSTVAGERVVVRGSWTSGSGATAILERRDSKGWRRVISVRQGERRRFRLICTAPRVASSITLRVRVIRAGRTWR